MNNGDLSGSDANRRDMVESQLRARGIHDSRVLQAMLQVPRHEFVPPESRAQAYEDRPLSIGEQQTISQPFIIAVSLQALALSGSESVLEIGTGSGYQTALLCLLAKDVYSVERHASLAHNAQQYCCNADIVRESQSPTVLWVGRIMRPITPFWFRPRRRLCQGSLIEQLADRGRLVIPVGPPHTQELQLIRKHRNEITTKTLDGCRFVPLVGVEGY